MKTKTYKVSITIRVKKFLLNELEGSADKVLKSSLFRRVSIEEKLLFLREIANARSSLWEQVYLEYPELVGKNLSVNDKHIIII